MKTKEEQQALSLAATIQALCIVHEIANEGVFDTERAFPVLQALVNYNPIDTLSAYGNDIKALSHGIQQTSKLFNDSLNRDISQYLLTVISIELKLVKNTQMRHCLQSDLQRISHQQGNEELYSDSESEDSSESYIEGKEASLHRLTNDAIIKEFADLYKQTASQTEPRIMVKGNHEFLQQENLANQIRALLLAALRGAAFFRHNGGKRFDLMIKRSQYLKILNSL